MDKIIKIDIDDVLIDLLGTWVNTINKRYNLNVDPNEIKDWDMTKSFTTLTSEQIFTPLFEESLWKKVHPKKYSIKYLQKIKDEFSEKGYKVKLVTSTHYKNISYKIEYVIYKYFPYISYDDIIICKDKYLIKGEFAIDDYYKNFENDDCVRILISKPYNKNISPDLYDYRCENLKEVYEQLKKIIK